MVDIHLIDAEFIIQGIQLVAIILAVSFMMYFLINKKRLTHKNILAVWTLFSLSVLAATIVFVLTVYNYVHNDRPQYKTDNQMFSKQNKSK